MIEIIIIREIIKIDIGQIAEIEEHQTEVEVCMGKIKEEDCVTLIIIEVTRRDNFRDMQNCTGQNFRGGDRRNYRNGNFRRGRSRARDRQYSNNFRRNDRSSSSRSGSGSRTSTNRDRIKCCKCREYNHFAKDCLTLQVEKESEQIQQMYNMDEEQTTLKIVVTDTYDNLNKINSVEKTIGDHLIL